MMVRVAVLDVTTRRQYVLEVDPDKVPGSDGDPVGAAIRLTDWARAQSGVKTVRRQGSRVLIKYEE